jgi:hypothetical protein
MLAQFDLFRHLFDPQFLWILLWVGLGVFTLVLCVLLMTRWGDKQPVQKCTILSVWFHFLLMVYATSITIVSERHGQGNSVTINLSTAGAEPSPASRANESVAQVPDLPTTKTPPPVDPLFPPMAAAPRPKTAPPPAEKPVAKPVAAKPPPSKPLTAKPAVAKLTPPEPAASFDVPPPAAPQTNSPPPMPATTKLPEAAAPKRAETAPRVAAKSPSQAKPTPAKTTPPKPAPADARPPEADLTKSPTPAAAKAAKTDSLTAVAKPSVLADLPDPTVDVSPQSAPPAATPEARMTEIPRRDLAATPNLPKPDVAPAAPAASAGVATLTPIDPGAVELVRPGATAAAVATPELYRERTAPDRDQVVAQHGGSARTEAAVNKALRWLASAQEADGRWNPARYGGGRESQALGHDRGGAGARADTGISGLALLAMLGAGHTHRRGDYRPTVNRGLDFLIASQHPNGNLGGNAEPFAFMYCHGMATLAMSEALAMTGDEKLREPVRKAIAYTLYAQNRTTGGWRYRPSDTGDLSQMGWQLMALKSAELGGIDVPDEAKAGMVRFVQAASSGSHGGLASYRPGEQVSRTMTAEGLLCRQFLGMSRAHPAGDEAGNFLLGELPGAGDRNFYYWYYGTLSMYQLQGDHWRKWNEALTRQLVESQAADGDLAGSWEANDVWGSYGGRVYSTSLATLCLEVYYRYLPLYVEAAGNGETRRK